MKTCLLTVLLTVLAGCGWNPKPRNILGMGVPASTVMPITTVPRHLSVIAHNGYYQAESQGQLIAVTGYPEYVDGHWVDTAQAYSFTYGYTNEARWEQPPLYPNLRVAPGQVPASYQEFGIPISPPGIRH